MEISLPSNPDLTLDSFALHKIPDQRKGIYCFWDTNEKIILYIGKSLNLKSRLSGHKSKYLNTVGKIDLYFYDSLSSDELDYYESVFINTLKPLYNQDKAYYKLKFYDLNYYQEERYFIKKIKELHDDKEYFRKFLLKSLAANVVLLITVIYLIL